MPSCAASALPLRADRSLARVRNLPPDVRAAALRRFTTCREVLAATELQLVVRLDLFLPDVRLLIEAVARHVAPPPPSALALLGSPPEHGRAGASTSAHFLASAVPTGLTALDAHLGGGLPARAVTELVGPAGAGKTQLCLAVAAHALIAGAAEGSRVLYVDTEGSFSASRLLQLLQARGAASAMPDGERLDAPYGPPRAHHGVPPAEELLRRLTVLRPQSWAEYCTCITTQLELELLTPPRVRLLLVDSIAMAVHRQFDKENDVLRRQQAVVGHAARLKHYADAHALCVLCVNQVVAGQSGAYGPADAGDVGAVQGRDDAQLHAYLGTAWAHSVNVRLAIEHPGLYDPACPHAPSLPRPPQPGTVGTPASRPMVLRVAKAPLCAEAAFAYRVGTVLEAQPLPTGGQ